MKQISLIFLFLLSLNVFSQDQIFYTQDLRVNTLIDGTLYTPEDENKNSLVILIAGSGPTDRNGNNTAMPNNSLKFLAQGLAQNGISVYSYDKRLFEIAKIPNFKEEDLSFQDFIQDAIDVVNYFKKEKTYKKIIVVGHSEGSLIGMVASREAKADGFISLAGAGFSIDNALVFQINQNAPQFLEETKSILATLKKGNTVADVDPSLYSLFRPSVQPYVISWLQYDPKQEIKKLNKIPVMIINGSADIQVQVSEAEALKEAKPNAKYLIIQDMNHVLKIVKNRAENQNSYTNPNLPVAPELISEMSKFVKSIK
ncbi:MAG TPA: alpha/beta hydrolase [Flavobacterium sp.]|nr:alpha/beta hydrolase [Flavobacterium sp.]